MYKYSFIQKTNKLGLARHNFLKEGTSKLGINKWIILIIILLASCAPSTQDNNTGSESFYPNTINGCVEKVIDRETFNHLSFENCVRDTNQELTNDVRREIIDYLLSASNNELQSASEVIVSRDLARFEDSTKDEFAGFIIKEIEEILDPYKR